MSFIFRYSGTLSYILCVLLVNAAFTHLPFYHLLGHEVSPGDIVVGSIYVMRDFAQREIGHKVIFAMAFAALLSYLLSDPIVAQASLGAFVVGELIDWAIFSFTRRPLSDRLLWSSAISSPIDTLVFLWILNRINPVEFSLMTFGKILGVLAIWWYWTRTQKREGRLCRSL